MQRGLKIDTIRRINEEHEQKWVGWVKYWKPFKKIFNEDTPRWTMCATHAYDIAFEIGVPPAQNNTDLARILNSISDRSFENRRGVGRLVADYRLDLIKRHLA